jgi:hypothetical protein
MKFANATNLDRKSGGSPTTALYQGTTLVGPSRMGLTRALEAAEKVCTERESNASGAKARRILNRLRPD